MTACFLQMRLDSTRLPQKALLPLGGKTMAEQVMLALKTIRLAETFVLLTDQDSLPILQPLALNCGFSLFCGPKDDVLHRFVLAVDAYKPDTLLRATGDNPLVSAQAADRLLQMHQEGRYDYSAFQGLPIGTGVEAIAASALKEAHQKTNSAYDREHVTPFIYNNPQYFSLQKIKAPAEFLLEHARVTVDTQEDYTRVQKIYADLYNGKPLLIGDVIQWLQKNNG